MEGMRRVGTRSTGLKVYLSLRPGVTSATARKMSRTSPGHAARRAMLVYNQLNPRRAGYALYGSSQDSPARPRKSLTWNTHIAI
jgi:hypothetical protein